MIGRNDLYNTLLHRRRLELLFEKPSKTNYDMLHTGQQIPYSSRCTVAKKLDLGIPYMLSIHSWQRNSLPALLNQHKLTILGS